MIQCNCISTIIFIFLKNEIGIKIFDSKKKPVELINEGTIIIEQLRIIDNNINQLKEITKELKGE
jgi:hypothetical protein